MKALLRLCALLLALGGCTPLGDAVDAVRLLRDLGEPASADVAAAPREVRWAARGTDRIADLYEPAQPVAAIVLAPGLGRAGRRDPRLRTFASGLTRVGYRVLVPDVPNFQAQRVAAGDSAVFADALRHVLAEHGGSVAIAAISYAAGPAIMAALEPDLAPRVSAVAVIGGYYDTLAVVTFFTTGFFRETSDSPWQRRAPNAYGKWVFVLANAERIADPRDRTSLVAMARRKLDDLDADIDDLLPGLGPEGRAVTDLLANDDPARVPGLIATLPPAVRGDLETLSLARHELGVLRRLILIHGRDDAIIPYTESLALARATGDRAHVALLDSLAHADLGPGGLWDAVRLWRAAYELMRSRHDAVDSARRSSAIN